jgi:hypothetical protein
MASLFTNVGSHAENTSPALDPDIFVKVFRGDFPAIKQALRKEENAESLHWVNSRLTESRHHQQK